MKWRWGCMIGFLAALLFFSAAINRERKVQEYRGSFGVYYDAPVDGEKIRTFIEAQKEQGNTVAAWNEENCIFENTAAGKREDGVCQKIAGDKELVFGKKLSGGSCPLSDDETGCLVSEELAQSLFGSEDIIGKEIYMDGKSWLVRGILDVDGKLAAVTGNENGGYTKAAIQMQDRNAAASSVQNMLYEKLETAPSAFSEGGLYGALARCTAMIPLWEGLILTVLYSFSLIKKAEGDKRRTKKLPEKARKKETVFLLLRWLVFLAGIFGAWRLSGTSFTFSADYLPSMWSDFSFWSTLLEEKSSDFVKLTHQVLSLRDCEMLADLRRTAYLTAGTCVCLTFAVVRHTQSIGLSGNSSA